MKREIKFRGLRTDGKGWAYGDLVHDAFDGHSGNVPVGIRKHGCFPVEVIPETVGQFTGLHDRNGKEIYEGDKHSDGGVVMWNKDDASFCWHWENIETVSMGDEDRWAEITGNIHEPCSEPNA